MEINPIEHVRDRLNREEERNRAVSNPEGTPINLQHLVVAIREKTFLSDEHFKDIFEYQQSDDENFYDEIREKKVLDFSQKNSELNC